VGDSDNLWSQTQREQQFGGVGNETHDAHYTLTLMAKLSEQQIEDRLRQSSWRAEGQTIVRELSFADFASAMAFVDSVAEAAEAANHHPDILIHGWNKVRLELSTHSEGGLTQADFDLASLIDELG
jgi:4a-hydroxytetrahydrobiopterin dehydratase